MPPKGKKGKKGAKEKIPALLNGLTKDEVSREQLEQLNAHMQEKLDKDMEERNFFQVERDQVHTFGEICTRRLDEALAEEGNLEREMTEDEEHHQMEIKVFRQKMKHLLCEHHCTLSEMKEECEAAAQDLQREMDQLGWEFHEKMKNVMVDIQELNYDNYSKEVQLKQDEIEAARDYWEKQVRETIAKFEESLNLLQLEMRNTRKSYLINAKLEAGRHIVAFQKEMRDIFDRAHDLDMKMQHNRDIVQEIAKKMADVKEKHIKIIPKIKKTVVEKKTEFTLEKKELFENPKSKALLKQKMENEDLEERLRLLQQEKEILNKAITDRIQKIREKEGLKLSMLRMKLQELTNSLHTFQTQLIGVLADPLLNQITLSGVAKKGEESLDRKNSAIQDYTFKISVMSKAQSHIVLTSDKF